MKRWKMILASALAVIVQAVVPLSVMAATTPTPNVVTPAVIKPDLVIVAPRAVLNGKEMQLTVFQRDDQAPVLGVDIWAVTKDRIEDLKKNVQDLLKDNLGNAGVSANATGIGRFGKLLGTTDGGGVLKHIFTDNGNYLLVANKAGFRPDFSALIVRGLPKGLAISNPNSVKLGDKVTITVHQRGTSDPVVGVGVWAIGAERAADLKGAISDSQTGAKNNPQITDYAAILKSKAIFLGNTDGKGQIGDYLFANAGRYILIAFKAGEGPAFGSIAIVGPKPSPTGTAKPDTRIGPTGKPTLPPSNNNRDK
jgi:hypothetical protein